MNILDQLVKIVNPQRAISRLHARAQLHVAEKQYDKIVKDQKRKYDGASKSRHYSDWYSPNLSVNQEVLTDLATLRNRSRELGRNNPHMIQAVRTIRNKVVGTGIIPTAKGLTKSQQKAIKEAWNSWGGKTACDYDDMNTFSGIQSLVMKVAVESGECLIRKVRGDSKEEVPLRLQILEGDFIDGSRHTGIWSKEGTMDYFGIQISKSGKRLGYWLFKNHPSEFGCESEFVGADEIIHVYEVERPGQLRGVPMSCGVMTRLRDLDDYEMTERLRSKIAASFAVFITEDGGDGNEGVRAEQTTENISPGMLKTLQPGQGIEVAQPPSTQGFGEFVRGNLRGIAAGLGISYESLSNDYSNVNFSSGRMGWIEMNAQVEHLQWNLLIPRFCDKVYPWFVEACQLKGIISFSNKVKVSWTAPRREMIDPYKEIQALKEQLRANLCSWQDVVRMFGYIPDELLEELKQDKEMWDKLGLMPTIDPRYDANRPPGEVDPELMKGDQKT